MRREKLISILESLLFVADKPMTVNELKNVIEQASVKAIKQALSDLVEEYSIGNRGFFLKEVSGGYRFYSNTRNSEWIRKFLGRRPVRLSRAALETLAIVAYRQPVTRPEIDKFRGVDSSGALGTLLSRKLIKILGRKDEVGQPILYGTSKDFLEHFGLRDLSTLPVLREFTELTPEHSKVVDDTSPAEESAVEADHIPEESAVEADHTPEESAVEADHTPEELKAEEHNETPAEKTSEEGEHNG